MAAAHRMLPLATLAVFMLLACGTEAHPAVTGRKLLAAADGELLPGCLRTASRSSACDESLAEWHYLKRHRVHVAGHRSLLQATANNNSEASFLPAV